MMSSAIQKFAEEMNGKFGLNLNFVVKPSFLDTSYVLKNGDEVLKEHDELAVVFAYMQGMNFVLSNREVKSNV